MNIIDLSFRDDQVQLFFQAFEATPLVRYFRFNLYSDTDHLLTNGLAWVFT